MNTALLQQVKSIIEAGRSLYGATGEQHDYDDVLLYREVYRGG